MTDRAHEPAIHIPRQRKSEPSLKERASVAQSAGLQHRKDISITLKKTPPWEKKRD